MFRWCDGNVDVIDWDRKQLFSQWDPIENVVALLQWYTTMNVLYFYPAPQTMPPRFMGQWKWAPEKQIFPIRDTNERHILKTIHRINSEHHTNENSTQTKSYVRFYRRHRHRRRRRSWRVFAFHGRDFCMLTACSCIEFELYNFSFVS